MVRMCTIAKVMTPQLRSNPQAPMDRTPSHPPSSSDGLPQDHRQVLLVRRPSGIPSAADFEVVRRPMPRPGPGEVLVRNAWLSVEPAMRGWVSAVANYSQPVPLGAVMRSFAAGHVVASDDGAWPVGTPVTGLLGWQEYAVVRPEVLRRVEDADLPLSTALGVLGINGVTAHYGLLEVGCPRPGETVVVSTAAGGVGSAVGQIARMQGCRTVGITGGEVKRQLCLKRYGYDAALDYRAASFESDLARELAGGVNVYFDNTAGRISDLVWPHLAVGARIVVCGTAGVASWDPWPQGPRLERHLLVKRARVQGFVIFDHDDHGPVARRDLAAWIRDGRLVYDEDVLEGIEQAPGAIEGLYRGENLGKRLIRVAG